MCYCANTNKYVVCLRNMRRFEEIQVETTHRQRRRTCPGHLGPPVPAEIPPQSEVGKKTSRCPRSGRGHFGRPLPGLLAVLVALVLGALHQHPVAGGPWPSGVAAYSNYFPLPSPSSSSSSSSSSNRQLSPTNWFGISHQPATWSHQINYNGSSSRGRSHPSSASGSTGAVAVGRSEATVTTALANLDPFELVNGVAAGLTGSLAKLLMANSNFGKLISELQEGISSRASCVACLTVTDFFRSPIYSKSAMSAAIRTICITLKLQKPKICHGISHAFEDDLDYIGRHSQLSPEEMCSTLLSVDCTSQPSEKLNWTVFIPPKPMSSPLYVHVPDNSLPDSATIVQVTDMHADLHYQSGSDASCDEPVCCRKLGAESPLEGKDEEAGLWGDYRKCDSPLRTVVNALEQISKSHPEAEYWLWTGDIGPHDHFSSRDEIISHVRVVTLLMKQYVKVPVLPVIGNHEASPANSFPPPSISGSRSISWLYEFLAEEWAHWLPETALETLRYGGFYSINLRPRLRTIVLNTNYCARLNPWTLYDSVDPGSQLNWLVSELMGAETTGDKVHILGHIAPDPTECTKPWLSTFLQILERFQDIILGQFYGHSHKDEFRVYHSREGKAIGFGLIGPSLTSYKGNNPSYRLYHLNQVGHVHDYETFFFNLTEANLAMVPSWRRLYKFSESYGFPSVSHENLNYLLQLMRMDDELFQMFYRFYSRQADVPGRNFCNDLCKANLLDELAVDERQKPKNLSKKYS